MQLADFDYPLPADLIAQQPLPQRDASRLLVIDPQLPAPQDSEFRQLPELLDPGDLLVVNDTRVIAARLFGHKASGGRVEILLDRITGTKSATVQLRASHAPAIGSTLSIGPARARVTGRQDRFFDLEFDVDVPTLIAAHGSMPLPPYIDRPADAQDAERYQTVYHRAAGAVAAPTAGLHFTEQVLQALAARGIGTAFVTLHVGSGTFLPVKTDDLTQHRMHAEHFDVPPATAEAIEQVRQRHGRVVAVGTTTLRALETCATANGRVAARTGETDLFIRPGYQFRAVDRLITNFHLPRSTLLMLVCAFSGHQTVMSAYRHAIAARYRFYSYGDAMLLSRA